MHGQIQADNTNVETIELKRCSVLNRPELRWMIAWLVFTRKFFFSFFLRVQVSSSADVSKGRWIERESERERRETEREGERQRD